LLLDWMPGAAPIAKIAVAFSLNAAAVQKRLHEVTEQVQCVERDHDTRDSHRAENVSARVDTVRG
jgi:hypothetical protein